KSATFVGDGRTARLVGVTGQFLGWSDEGLRTLYRGSIGPLPVRSEARQTVARIGDALAAAFGLRGLFGVDMKLDGVTPWPVEINPRYTASVEVLEEALGVSLLAEHARAFIRDEVVGSGFPVVRGNIAERSRSLLARSGSLGAEGWVGQERDDRPEVDRMETRLRPVLPDDRSGIAAKFILNATRPAVVPREWPWSDPADPHPTVADLPSAGTILWPGDPVLTVLARGTETARLKAMIRLWQRRIDAWPAAR
ncbi:MAG TPA: ATP-grasp domain-containing protein, partial [Isosphaeraceae bacterium]